MIVHISMPSAALAIYSYILLICFAKYFVVEMIIVVRIVFTDNVLRCLLRECYVFVLCSLTLSLIRLLEY